jgi:hypothetical protein
MGTNAQFNQPTGITIFSNGTILVADTANPEIRQISPSGEVTTFVGGLGPGTTDGQASIAKLNSPLGIRTTSFISQILKIIELEKSAPVL